MRMRPTLLLPLALLAALVLAGPAQASFQGVFNDYRSDQRVNACAFSPGQLNSALGGVPPDIEAYAPNFIDEVNRALGTHASGGCASGGGGGQAPAQEAPEPQPEAVPEVAPAEPEKVDPGPARRPPGADDEVRVDPGVVAELVPDGPQALAPVRETPAAVGAVSGVIGLLGLGVLAMGVVTVARRRGNGGELAVAPWVRGAGGMASGLLGRLGRLVRRR